MGLLVIPFYFVVIETRQINARNAHIARSGLHVLMVGFGGTCLPLAYYTLLRLFNSRITVLGKILVVLVWQLLNVHIYLSWGLWASKRALTPSTSPPLQFAYMLSIDMFVNLLFIDSSPTDPMFWFVLCIELAFQMCRDTGVFDDAIDYIVAQEVIGDGVIRRTLAKINLRADVLSGRARERASSVVFAFTNSAVSKNVRNTLRVHAARSRERMRRRRFAQVRAVDKNWLK